MSVNTLIKQNEIDRMIQEGHSISPRVNIYETEHELILEAEMIGLNKDSIDIQFQDKELRIRGSQKQSDLNKKYTALFTERNSFDYQRTFVIDVDIQRDKVKAKYEDGILTLRLPKGEKSLPKKIKIS